MVTALLAWRQRMSWSQRRAAEELGVSLPTYQSWEREERLKDGNPLMPPKTGLLAAAALELGVTSNDEDLYDLIAKKLKRISE